ncbi:hypothetical protein M407DRAFT_27279 [Tulasnella calospora MUT 4182]|uniref:UvrD-like helicase ATP-binding domain-containing protein n=1 Tax=Tulasnella calospora MUT 4182 TaxID=1051891 RepID=A0A0C3Q3E4_9AGAM|nr:hypothetical protein M407DRAFT_27279 [Tulasnella calospora MUT 4182]
MVTSREDVPVLLGILVGGIQGLLEAVLTSSGQDAFRFRDRVSKALRNSLATSTPLFRACADSLGSFLITIPGEIFLERSVMVDYNAYKTVTAELDELNLAKMGPFGPTSPTKPGKRESQHARTNSVNRVSSAKSMPESASRSKSSSWSGPTAISNLPKLLTKFLENFFKSCVNQEIEEFAIDNLFKALTPGDPPVSGNVVPTVSKSRDPTPSDSAPVASPLKPEALSRLHYLSIKQEDIVKYLHHAVKPKSGNWPVVVSQRGIRRMREYVADKKEIFLRVEKKIKQLSVGFFPPQNQMKLLQKDLGIPIYTADLGDGLRLIYHIDFGAPTATDQESQFIRVFGVFQESEVDVKFWGTVAAQLSRRGQEYIERCTDRGETQIRFKGVETLPPTLSPPLDVSQWNKEGADIEVDESHFLELHRVLALEKFVPLSRTFFEAIQKFDEDSFMFAVSTSEYRIITHPSSCLVLGRSGTGKTTCMLFRMAVLDMDARESQRPARQMFVTQSRTLATKVRQYWAKLSQTERNEAAVTPEALAPGLSLLDIDEDAEDTASLPSKFSELKDSHFPVFLTYDQLCKLLEADYGFQFNPSPNATVFGAFRGFRHVQKQGSTRHPLISFEYFESNIWPHLDEGAKRGLHPILVYSEFMGVIKGSEASRSYPKRFLDRQAYESQSSRTHFGDPTERSRIYTLFEAYCKLRPPSSYDVADRVHELLAEVEKKGLPGNPVDYLYVDEAQDHLILDAALLRSVCPNPDGLFFAGDTAQTISVGSTFRFSELKAFLYRLERDDEMVKRGSRKPVNPQFFQLSTNYRSHSGIVKSAAFLVRLIISYFGHCIDSLTPEASLVDISAHKPVFFLGRESQDDFLRLISAKTMIIVRDEIAAQKLRKIVGRVAVLTLYESKGMEFDDVLLYDFFNDSLATPTDWRAILHAEHQGKAFDGKRHAILRTELKALYVGLTRARERVWIWDQSTKGADLETLLTALDLATVHDIMEAVPQLGGTSSSHDWSQRAQQYFSKGLFLEAGLAFKNAGMDWWESVAAVYGERQATMRLPQQHQRFQSSFTRIAREFERLAECQEGLHNPITRCHLFLNAGECYAAVSNHWASASAFIRGKRYTEAAYHYRMAGSFEKAVDVISRYPVDPEVAESITYAAKLEFTKRGDMPSLHKAWKLFGTTDDFLEFLEDHGFDEHRIGFLESIGEYERVGDIHREAEDYISAVRQFRLANTSTSYRKAAACLLEGLRANISFAIGYGKRSEQLSQLFELCQAAELALDEQDEVDLLRAVSELDSATLKEHGLRCIRSGNNLHALLALDSWASSDGFQVLPSAPDVEAMEILTTCLKFSTVINALARTPKLLDKPAARGLFCVTSAKATGILLSDTVSIKRHSFLYDSLNGTTVNRKAMVIKAASGSYPRSVVEAEIRRGLWARLNGIISRIDTLAQESRPYELCIPFVTTGGCLDIQQGLCWRDHPSDAELTVPKFNSRFRLHILTIALLDHPEYEQWDEHKISRAAKQLSWLDRLFNPATNRPLAEAALHWCFKDTTARTHVGVHLLETVLGGSAWLDTDVAIAFVEEVCGQLIFNQDAHLPDGRGWLTMPRTWIIRAFLRGASPKPNEATPGRFVSLLGKFVDILLLREYKERCRLQSHVARYQWLVRLSRCLGLVGHNIPALREMVLSIFKGMGNSCSDLQLYSSCISWLDVVEALKATSSRLDEVISVKWKDDETGNDYGFKSMLFSGEKPLLEELSLVLSSTASASVAATASEQLGSQFGPITPATEIEQQQIQEASLDSSAPVIPDDTELLQKSARKIQAFILRHHTRADGSLEAAFEEVAKRFIRMQTSDPPSRFLLLCLRGPLPHVVSFLEKFQYMVQHEVSAVGKKMAYGKDENMDEIFRKLVKLRRIRNDSKRFIMDLHPSSEFYFQRKSNSLGLASVSEIVARVKLIPALVQNLRAFVEIPEDVDYELGVEPILSDRAPWL